MREKSQAVGEPTKSFDELFELAIAFLSSPGKLWASGKLAYLRIVMRLVFGECLAYSAKTGFRTPKTSFPFKVLGDLGKGFKQMAEGVGFELEVQTSFSLTPSVE